MRKICCSIVLLLLINQLTLGQVKPELPANYFDGFSYQLPTNFNYKDAAQLETEISKLSSKLFQWNSDAVSKYTVKDSIDLYYLLARSSVLAMLVNEYQQSIDATTETRKIKPTPDYMLPFGLINLAYARASLQKKDDGSAAFTTIFSAALVDEFKSIHSDFRNDIVNQSKGALNAASTGVWWKNLTRTIEQTMNNAGGKLNFSNANSLLTQYQQYNLRKKYQPLIEKALFTISPSKVQETVIKIPMRDGIKLNAFMYKDQINNEKLPAIVSLSPYPSGAEATRGNVFATNGYIYVYVDTRGRRDSEGDFMPYEDDARDFYDIIDWVSKQAWCNGQVATSGGSYLGFDQWQAIRKKYKHPALKAINPMVSVGFGVDFPRSANMFYAYILQWATYVTGKELNQSLFSDNKFWDTKFYEHYKNRLPFSKLDSVVGMPNAYFQKWVSHPDYDHYWQGIMPSEEDYKSIDIPIFSITGYYDADQIGAMYYYDQHQKYGTEKAKNKHQLLIGPYNHSSAQWQPGNIQNGIPLEKEAQIPIYKYVIWWFDWVLKGKQQPAFIKDKITYFETGNHSWKGISSFKKLTTDSLELFLTPDIVSNNKRKDLRSLSWNKPVNNTSLKFSHDIAMALDSAYLFASPLPFDDSIYMTSAYNLVFESSPLTQDIVLSDKIITRIFATLNVPDADFEINLQEVAPDGKDQNVATGSIRVRYRNGGEKPQLAKPGEVVQLNFDGIYIYIKKITKGSKLRLVFQSINNPWLEKNYGFGGEVSKESSTALRIIEANILMGKTYPSKVVLPITKD
jgi:putative CocE/NonD family hydrolase